MSLEDKPKGFVDYTGFKTGKATVIGSTVGTTSLVGKENQNGCVNVSAVLSFLHWEQT